MRDMVSGAIAIPRQAGDVPQPCRTGFGWYSKGNVSHETTRNPLQLFPRNSCKITAYCFRETRRGGLVRPASKSCRFSHHPLRVPRAWHRDFAACGQRSGLLALNLASIFEKLLDQKTFSLPAARFFCLFSQNTTPFPRNSTKKFDSRKKICYNKNGCRSMTVAVDFLWKPIAAAIDSHPHHSITIYGLWKKNQEMNGAPTPASSERIGFFYDYSRCKCWQLLSEISVD